MTQRNSSETHLYTSDKIFYIRCKMTTEKKKDVDRP